MRRRRLAALAAFLFLPPLAGGCARGDETAAAPAADAAMDGLSPEQIRQQAEPMSPEQAAQLGIVDTTIHLEQLVSPDDSLLFSETPPPQPPDTAS